MQRVSGANYAANAFGAGKSGYQDYNPSNGQPGTTPNASALNALQEEIASYVEAQGIALNANDNTQLGQAIAHYVTARLAPYELAASEASDLANLLSSVETPAQVAAAITAALATYAPLNSPAFTGGPTAPTPGAGDNSGRIATTAFLASYFAPLSAFANSLAANGYAKLPNGLIIQWGAFTIPSGASRTTTPVTFPIAFPNGCLSVAVTQTTNNGSGLAAIVMGALSAAVNGFTAQADTTSSSNAITAGQAANYIALGW